MTLAHILILSAFILIGAVGLAAIQASISKCLQHGMASRKRSSHLTAASGIVRRA